MNRSVQFGEGLFETIRWRSPEEKLKLHYRRLKNSADFLGMGCPSYEEFLELIYAHTKSSENKAVKFLLLSTGSDVYYSEPAGYEVKVVVKDMPPKPERVELTFSSLRRHSQNPLWRHKSLNFLFNIFVKREATRRGFFDAIVLNEREHITECSASNIILLRGDRLYTPARESGLLWGTTLEFLRIKGADIREEFLSVRDVLGADSVFVCNSLMGVVPVAGVGGTRIPVDEDVLKALKEIYT